MCAVVLEVGQEVEGRETGENYRIVKTEYIALIPSTVRVIQITLKGVRGLSRWVATSFLDYFRVIR